MREMMNRLSERKRKISPGKREKSMTEKRARAHTLDLIEFMSCTYTWDVSAQNPIFLW